MPFGYYAVVTVHVLSAFVWLGGMLFLGLVGAPALRAVEPPALRQRLFQDIGTRFRSVGWIAIAILVVTGVANLWYRGWLGELPNADFWRTATGRALAAKLACVTVMIATSAVHDFALGPAAGKSKPGSPEAVRLRRQAARLARVNAIVGVLLVIAAVRLAR
jgi:copper resistance protein D